MVQTNIVADESQTVVTTPSKNNKILYILFILLILFVLTTLAISAGTLSVILNRLNNNSSGAGSNVNKICNNLVDSIEVQQMFDHLKQLQAIADENNGTRASGTNGFNLTVDYITKYLKDHTNLKVQQQYFPIRTFQLERNPILISNVNGIQTNYTFPSDFTSVPFSGSASFSTPIQLVVIPNSGCFDSDWGNISTLSNRVALVQRSDNCTFVEISERATKNYAAGLLIYNDGIPPYGFEPIKEYYDPVNTTFPVLSLSYSIGFQLVQAARNSAMNATVIISILVKDTPPSTVANICADTPTGDVTKTILVGSHSDSVPYGSGINDNGSGSAANLALAVNLARLLQTSVYLPYAYRVRFCWWAAEEMGLLGSKYHVQQAALATAVEGERLQDYLVNINIDMLGSPNFFFGIYDGKATQGTAAHGSIQISELLREWFSKQELPWDIIKVVDTDHIPFLAVGIVIGGLFSGAAGTKTNTKRDKYDQILGQGHGGIADTIYDPCYHEECDTVQNINPFVYEKMTKAAAYVLQYLGQL
ncbi:unnamed protein product [Didymodactylos carnosus]|uniref:Peptide hydrolase n=2 Tax=Didymodactylos carnosus TaxID=1234261 RepID=A0A814J1D7_9BILA|nr:unnamed protein product [Didymodactylos carnosus]CAF3802653.1 unnamed protein product [Didymodactylos carnosus]